MNKIILMLVLAVVSSGAMAEWVDYGGDRENTFKIYINPSTLRKNGTNRKIWTMFDYKSVQIASKLSPLLPNENYLTEETQFEFSCSEEQVRTLTLILFSGNMGQGEVVYQNANKAAWMAISPDSINEALAKYACRKK